MNLQQLTTFCMVLSEKSMTAAAQKLFLTQPAVSQQIRQLEEELGTELLVRGVRQVTPTPAGEVLNDYARRIIALIDQADLAVKTVGTEVKGPFRFGTLNSIGLHLISPIFGIFLKNNKDVSLRIRYGNGAQIVEALEKGDLDMAFLPEVAKEYGEQTSSLEARAVELDEMWLVCAPSFFDGDEVSLKEYCDHPVVWLSQEYPGFENLLHKELKKLGAHVHPVFDSSNVGTLKRVIESGLGWGFLPAHSIKKQVRSGRMKRVLVPDFSYEIRMMCYYPKNLKSMKVLEVFLKSIQAEFKST